MPSRVFAATPVGFECATIEVEVDILNGPASIAVVGLADIAVQESKERIRSAIKNSGLEYPRRKKTVNLAPADIFAIPIFTTRFITFHPEVPVLIFEWEIIK